MSWKRAQAVLEAKRAVKWIVLQSPFCYSSVCSKNEKILCLNSINPGTLTAIFLIKILKGFDPFNNLTWRAGSQSLKFTGRCKGFDRNAVVRNRKTLCVRQSKQRWSIFPYYVPGWTSCGDPCKTWRSYGSPKFINWVDQRKRICCVKHNRSFL